MSTSRLSPHLRDRIATAVGRPGWRRVLLLRRLTAAVLVGTALVLALLPRPGSGGTPVVVTTVDIAAGGALTGDRLTVRHWPTHLVPAGAVRDVAEIEGRVLVGAARAGEPVTDLRLAGSGAALTAGPGAAAVAVRPADAALTGVLAPGSRVDVVAAGETDGSATVLASAASVLAVLPGTGGDRGVVMVAMPQDVAARVAAATLTSEVAVTLR